MSETNAPSYQLQVPGDTRRTYWSLTLRRADDPSVKDLVVTMGIPVGMPLNQILDLFLRPATACFAEPISKAGHE